MTWSKIKSLFCLRMAVLVLLAPLEMQMLAHQVGPTFIPDPGHASVIESYQTGPPVQLPQPTGF